MDKQHLQALHDSAQQNIDQARGIQNAIKRLNSLKKESEVKQQQQNLLTGLQDFIKDLEDVHGKAGSSKKALERSLGDLKTPSSDSQDGDKDDKLTDKQKRLPLPDDQDNMYHLKARMMPQYQNKNNALQAEVVLMSCRNELRAQRERGQVNYNRDTNLSAATTLHVIHMYEKKAKAAEVRAEILQAELNELKGTSNEKPASSKSTGQSFLGPNNRVNDVIRKNEVLVVENRNQQHEIQRLKRDNAEMTKLAKHAQGDRNHIMSQLSTSEMARKDLFVRYQKQREQHDRLNRSLTRQSTNWIESRKHHNQLEEDIRWANVGHASLHGSHERTHMHAVPRNVDQPRYMFPAEQWSKPIKS